MPTGPRMYHIDEYAEVIPDAVRNSLKRMGGTYADEVFDRMVRPLIAASRNNKFVYESMSNPYSTTKSGLMNVTPERQDLKNRAWLWNRHHSNRLLMGETTAPYSTFAKSTWKQGGTVRIPNLVSGISTDPTGRQIALASTDDVIGYMHELGHTRVRPWARFALRANAEDLIKDEVAATKYAGLMLSHLGLAPEEMYPFINMYAGSYAHQDAWTKFGTGDAAMDAVQREAAKRKALYEKALPWQAKTRSRIGAELQRQLSLDRVVHSGTALDRLRETNMAAAAAGVLESAPMIRSASRGSRSLSRVRNLARLARRIM